MNGLHDARDCHLACFAGNRRVQHQSTMAVRELTSKTISVPRGLPDYSCRTINPEAPTREPAMISMLLESTKPVAAAARPE